MSEAYLRATADPGAVVGRKVAARHEEVVALVGPLKKLEAGLLAELSRP